MFCYTITVSSSWSQTVEQSNSLCWSFGELVASGLMVGVQGISRYFTVFNTGAFLNSPLPFPCDKLLFTIKSLQTQPSDSESEPSWATSGKPKMKPRVCPTASSTSLPARTWVLGERSEVNTIPRHPNTSSGADWVGFYGVQSLLRCLDV